MARKDKTVLLGIVLVAIALIAVIGIIYYITTLPKQQIIQYPPQPGPTQYKLTLPTVFTVNDIWKGQTMTGVTIEIYKYATKELLESGTVTNTYTTTNPLTSGDRYWVKLSKGGAFKFYDVTIPYESSPSASNHYITLDFYTIGSYPIKLFDPEGNAISSGSHYNVTAQNNKYPSFTLMIGPPADDTGVMNTYDPIKTLDRQVLFFIHVSGDKSNYLIVSNIPVLYSASSTDRNFGYALNPAELVRDKKPDGTYASEGIKSLTLTFDASGLPKGTSTVHIEVFVYAFTNENYFKTYGTHPEGYVSITSVSYDFYIDA
jgi:hypothetical protein